MGWWLTFRGATVPRTRGELPADKLGSPSSTWPSCKSLGEFRSRMVDSLNHQRRSESMILLWVKSSSWYWHFVNVIIPTFLTSRHKRRCCRRKPTNESLVHDDPERPPVAGARVAGLKEHFGGDVVGRSDRGICLKKGRRLKMTSLQTQLNRYY